MAMRYTKYSSSMNRHKEYQKPNVCLLSIRVTNLFSLPISDEMDPDSLLRPICVAQIHVKENMM